MRPYEVIEQLKATNSRLDKERIVEEAWNAGCYDFFIGSQLAFDSLITFGVKQIPYSADAPKEFSDNFEDFIELTTKLQKRQLTGHAARDAILDLMRVTDAATWDLFYRLVLLKDYAAGLSETTINKVLKKIGGEAKKYLIKEYSCQLAFDCEGREDKFYNKKVLLEDKLDGARLNAHCNTETGEAIFLSRNGKENANYPHIIKLLEHMTKNVFKESVVIDGEIMSKDFQATMKQFNRKKNVNTSDAIFNIFDIIPLKDFKAGICNKSQIERKKILAEYFTGVEGPIDLFKYEEVDLATEYGRKRFEEFKKEALAKGAEGMMIKNPNAPYECDRTEHWMKYKPVITVDLTVIDVIDGMIEVSKGKKREDELMMSTVVCEGYYEGKHIKVNVGGGWTLENRREIFKDHDKIIGTTIEIEADILSKSADSETWSLRFPRFLRFRDDK